MRWKLSGAIAIAATVLVSATGAAAQEARPDAGAKSDGQLRSDAEIRAALEVRVDSTAARGIVVGIVERDGTRRFVAYGVAADSGASVDEHTIFEIGSISKTFTALLLADAVVRGDVELDQPVATLLPDSVTVPEYEGQLITLEHLATHRSGLPRLPVNLFPAAFTDPYATYDAARLFAFLDGYALTRAPGASAVYSNLGGGLLGYALVALNGASSWGALVDERITDPLGMDETFVDVPAALADRVAQGHNALGAATPAWHFDALAGAGALRSTAADMLSYLAAQLHPPDGALGDAIRLTHEPRADFAPITHIGLAWLIRDMPDGDVNLWHNGGTGGFASFAAFDPATGRAIVARARVQVIIGSQLSSENPAVPRPGPTIEVKCGPRSRRSVPGRDVWLR